jgi:hypothetical protein
MRAGVVGVLLGAGVLVAALLAALVMTLTGGDAAGLWAQVRLPLLVLAAGTALMTQLALALAVGRLRARWLRPMGRYQLVLSQADEASFEEAAAAFEQLVQVLRESVTARLVRGQPWLAIESWFVPPDRLGETGSTGLVLLCEPRMRDAALAALRRAYPDLALRAEREAPVESPGSRFTPGHVLRVRKARMWALPIVAPAAFGDASRSVLAGVIRQQQRAGRVSCVRWCLLPAREAFDTRAVARLERLAGAEHNAARAMDVQQAVRGAGGAMSHLELQAAVERRPTGDGHRYESFSELQSACRELLSPALSQRGANHLTERLMVARQRLYARRWFRGEPPLLADLAGSTLISPRELALLIGLPSLGSEHALPLQRNTVPNLPVPPGVTRARIVELPWPVEAEGVTATGPRDEVEGVWRMAGAATATADRA